MCKSPCKYLHLLFLNTLGKLSCRHWKCVWHHCKTSCQSITLVSVQKVTTLLMPGLNVKLCVKPNCYLGGELTTLTPSPRTAHWPRLRGLPYGLLRRLPLRTTLNNQPNLLLWGKDIQQTYLPSCYSPISLTQSFFSRGTFFNTLVDVR